jgi:hypothetical protein
MLAFASLFIVLTALTPLVQAEVMLQWFETEWDEMYRRLPEAAQIGYDYLWIPPPSKAPTGLGTKWGNVGYSLYDRFDLGDIPQRGSLATRYGTRGSLENMVQKAHQLDLKIIPDIIMNHNGNGPDFRSYPGMDPEDFHVTWEEGHANDLNYRRAPRMTNWDPQNGYGGTMYEDLASLIDIRTEDHPLNGDPLRFTGGNTVHNFVGSRPDYYRHVGRYDLYPYAYTNELASEMLYRWIVWLGNAIDYDGLRLDAGKHTPYEFFGWLGSGFLHEAQWNYNARYNYSDSNANEADELFENYLAERDDALIFAEILSYQSELDYWFGDIDSGVSGNTKNPMRFIDYPLKQKLYQAFSDGNLAALSLGGGGLDPQVGIMYAWGHDEDGPNKINLAYAYILTHVGFPMVYFTGNNIVWDDHGRSPDKRTWMIPGYDSQALADQYDDIANLVWIHQNFARGSEWERWADGDYLAYERFDDINANSNPDSGEALCIIALNDSGGDITKSLATSFADGTTLKDYTGNSSETPTVSGGYVDIKVPGNGGQGWVCYAPQNADGVSDTVQFQQDGSPSPTMQWVVPGGIHSPDKTQTLTRITSTNIRVDVFFTPTGGSVDSVMLKWGRGANLWTGYYDTGNAVVSGRYESMAEVNSTNWYMEFQITSTNVPEGLNVVKARAFNSRGAGLPALYNTFTEVVYVDRRGPEIDITHPADGATLYGDAVMEIENPDFTAYGMTVSVDGQAEDTAHEIMKGLWRYGLKDLSTGGHTVTVTTTEADWDNPRNVINTSIYTRAFSVVSNANQVSISLADGSTNKTPFFSTGVAAPGSPSDVKLYWDGYELPFNGGTYTNVFNHQFIFRDWVGNVVTERMWGAFANGQHFFEAVRVDAGVTSRAVSRVVFNLYGINAIDSDGDSLPDNVEMPFIDSEGAPGADQPWPGDDNNDFIPNYGETWTKLNPYNHSTFYTGSWDDQNDFDGDGYNNGVEVLAGYAEGNIYKYDIYNGGNYPTGGTPTVGSAATWTPEYAERGSTLTITYSPNQGPLSNAAQVVAHIGHSAKTEASWQDVIDTNMTASGTNWVLDYSVPTNATSVDFVFWDNVDTWDNNGGSDWRAQVQGSTSLNFNIDGIVDSSDYLVHGDAMYIWAAANGDNLYVATWGVKEASGGNDHFLYVTDELGDASDPAPGWNKSGLVFFDTSSDPYITAEGTNDWEAWNNISATVENGGDGNALEGEISMIDAFGSVPDAVYVAAVSYSTTNGGGINSQGPYVWNSDNNLDVMEFKRIPIASIRDEDMDGTFDVGSPEMWTVVNGDTNDANYGLRRVFLNELASESVDITVIIEPNVGTNSLSNVELISNINRRDFAELEPDLDNVTTASRTNYYRAYPMQSLGGGRYSYTISVEKCGAYRINARYRVNGGSYVYYTDEGLRRDCSVVASPKKALQVTMYELNPMIAEAVTDQFAGRSTFRDMYVVNTNKPDRISTNKLGDLGMNMVWLQPIHPIGSDNRQTDPSTGMPYDPGSPYAVQNYWKVNSVLGDPSSEAAAMQEFTNFVQSYDAVGIGVMLDGTFNHSAWDCQVGQPAVDMFDWATNANEYIRNVRPQWYSKRNAYGQHATYYGSGANNDIAPAPDRIDFGKWNDAADFYFGVYDALVQEAPADTNNAWSSKWYNRYLFEEDRFYGHDEYSREVWQYFAHYPIYWLEKTGHPEGTPKEQSWKGIDGLRCDFAQGLPNEFWEYCINKTRSVKWDFLFMAESLDGFREIVEGNTTNLSHGVGFRSSRHFDILNENMVFYWRDDFFQEFLYGKPITGTPDRQTSATKTKLDERKVAFDNIPILLNLTSHDEILPTVHQPSLMYAYATVASVAGVPMIYYGQEAGLQNDPSTYTNSTGIDAKNTFERYEENFDKSIPNFKRYNALTSAWSQGETWMPGLRDTYGRIAKARLRSPALQSQNEYFLSRTDTGTYDQDMFAIAKYEAAGVDAATQDVVFAVIDNDCQNTTNRGATFDLDATIDGKNWFGIRAGSTYNMVNLMSPNPTNYLWPTNKLGSDVINDGLYVALTGNNSSSIWWGSDAQFLKLVDVNAAYPKDDDGVFSGSKYSDWDWDDDGMANDWEQANGLDPNSATGDDGANGDADNDGMTNMEEYLARTEADNQNSLLALEIVMTGSNVRVSWDSVSNVNYSLEYSEDISDAQATWQQMFFGTAIGTEESVDDSFMAGSTSRFYRARVRP